MTNIFNPFGKDFKDVNKEDLERLKTVAEGWTVEYKQQKLNGKSIAKSIASFANSHGGLYFIGIVAEKSTNYALEFVGIEDSPDIIHDAIRDNLQPFPFFETFQIILDNKKKVIMAVIPRGENTPYINSDGKIYRRQESSSDPIAESNRFVIDQLYEQSKKYLGEIEDFRNSEFCFCKGEEEVPYLEIYANTAPFGHFFIDDFSKEINVGEILTQFNQEAIIKEKKKENGEIIVSLKVNMKFDSAQTYFNSIAIRNLANNDVAYNGLTVEIDVSGNLRVLLPLQTKMGSETFIEKAYGKKVDELNLQSIESINFLNTQFIFGSICGIIHNYVSYLLKKGYKEKVEFKMRLKNCWRSSLYIDSKAFLEYVNKFGIPICMKSEQYFPRYPSVLTVQEIMEKPIVPLVVLFSFVANSLGIPTDLAFKAVLEELQGKNEKE